MMNGSTDLLEEKIRNYFSYLHAELYFAERKLLDDLDVNKSENNKLQDLLIAVKNSIKTLEQQISFIKMSESKKINMKLLLQNLKNVNEIPCHLVSSAQADDQYSFRIHPSLENLESQFKIEHCKDSTFSLVSYTDIPPTDLVCLEMDKESESNSHISDRSESLTSLESEIYSQRSKNSRTIFRRGKSSRERKMTQKITQNAMEAIDIKHVESLYNFFVFRKQNNQAFNTLKSEISQFIKQNPIAVKAPQINEICLVCTRYGWFRGRVINVSKELKNQKWYEVYLIDQGRSMNVAIHKVRQIPPDLASIPPFVIQCQLHDPSCANWGPESKLQFLQVIKNKVLYMRVINCTYGHYEVDVLISSGGQLTSVLDLLLNTCTNVLSSSDDGTFQGKSSLSTRLVRLFPNSVRFNINEPIYVTISHVISPHKIYLNEAANMECLRRLQNKLNDQYENCSACDYTPLEDTYAVAYYKNGIRGLWHRGFIKKVYRELEQVDIFLVDFGLNLTLPFTKIMPLQETFSTLECQAIEARLSDIEPIGSKWSPEAIKYLDKFSMQETELKFIPTNVNPLSGILFLESGALDCCINAEMVALNLSISTGKTSLVSEWPQHNDLQENDGSSLIGNILKKLDINSDDDDIDIHGKPLMVQICRVVDPSTIYIKFNYNREKNDRLFRELQIHYSEPNERIKKEDWKVGDNCVVELSQIYSRGLIKDITENRSCKVLLIDSGAEEIMALEDLFEMHPYFATYYNMAYKASLFGIFPAGDTGKWSTTASEVLEQIFTLHKHIYVTKEDVPTDDKVLPVQMWYKHIIPGKGLEPNYCKYILINNLLLKTGLASRKSLHLQKDNVKMSEDQKDFLLDKPEKLISDGEKITKTSSFFLNNSKDSSKVLSIKSPKKEKINVRDWLKPLPIIKPQFKAVITCVCDITGVIFLRDEPLHLAYKDLENSMKLYFDENPPSRKNTPWEEGEICTVFYDEYWYRSKVLNIHNKKELEILMIDFGSRHVVPLKDVYVEILYPDIPAFASKVKLHNVHPKCGKWLTSDHDLVMGLIQENAHVIMPETDKSNDADDEEDLLEADIYFNNGVHLNKELIQRSQNLVTEDCLQDSTTDDDAILIEEEIEENTLIVKEENFLDYISDELKYKEMKETETIIEEENSADHNANQDPNLSEEILQYKEVELPKLNQGKVKMTILNVLSYNTVILQPSNNLLISGIYEDLNYVINKEAHNLPALHKIEINKCCLCKYYEDGKYYRAKIHNVDGLEYGLVYVLFVDIGKVESVSSNELKEIKKEWIKYPISIYMANINIESNNCERIIHVFEYLKKLIHSEKYVQICQLHPLTVAIFEEDGSLCYQRFINSGLIKLTC